MYTSVYIYRVKKENVEEFLAIEREAAKVYLEHGSINYDVYRGLNLTAMYGCAGFADSFDVDDDEEVLIGLNGFHDEAHHDETMPKVNADPRIQDLFAKVVKVTSLERTIHGKFELASQLQQP